MVNVRSTPEFLRKLENEIITTLKGTGISAKMDFEPIPTTRIFRAWVLAPKFKHMRPSERQDLVWRIADRVLSRDEQMRISSIFTLTENELKGVPEPFRPKPRSGTRSGSKPKSRLRSLSTAPHK